MDNDIEHAKELFKQGKTRDDDEKVYPCPLCMTIHEYGIPCMPMIEETFRKALLKEFKIINELEDEMKI